MKLVYIYHSGFAIEDKNCVLIIDYYKDILDDNKNELLNMYFSNMDKRLYILSSHAHGDHFNKQIFNNKREDITYILSRDIKPHASHSIGNTVFLEKGDVYADEFLKVNAFGSTDEGISFYIEVGGKRIFHAGDFNNWHWNEEVPEAEAAEYENAFLMELADISANVPELDLAMFPVDPRLGKDYMRGAEQFVSSIKTTLFAPMHFAEEHEKVSAFEKYAETKGVRFIQLKKRGDETEV